MSKHDVQNLKVSLNCYDLLPFHIMYDKNIKPKQADKNILLNRRRALENLVKLNKDRGNSNNKLVQHYFNKNTIPPIWAAIHTLSLGDILAIYNMFPRKDRVEISKKLLCKDKVKANQIAKLSAKINLIREIRNNINHYEPLIPSLMKYKDKNLDNSILSISSLLKTHYDGATIQGAKVIKRGKFIKLNKNSFNKKYVIFLNKILREL